MEAGKKRLAGDIIRQANSSEVTDLRREARDLKEVVAEQTLELRLLCPSSNKWNRRRVYLKESFVPHFQCTRRITDSATDASRWSFS